MTGLTPEQREISVTGNGSGRKALETVQMAAWLLRARAPIAAQIAALEDERTGLVLEPLRWALAAADAGRPYETILLEQVPTVLPVWETFTQILELEGYSASCGVLKAEQYGVPQSCTPRPTTATTPRPGTASAYWAPCGTSPPATRAP